MNKTITQPEQLAALAIKKAPYTAAKLTSGLTLLVYKQAKGTHWGMYSEHGKKKIAPADTSGGDGLNFSEAYAVTTVLTTLGTNTKRIIDLRASSDCTIRQPDQRWSR